MTHVQIYNFGVNFCCKIVHDFDHAFIFKVVVTYIQIKNIGTLFNNITYL